MCSSGHRSADRKKGLSDMLFLKKMGRYWPWPILRYYYDLVVAAASCCTTVTYFVFCTATGFVQCFSHLHLRGLVHPELHTVSTLLLIVILLMIMRLGALQSRSECCGKQKNSIWWKANSNKSVNRVTILVKTFQLYEYIQGEHNKVFS
jgi:hypothetical protein